MHVLLDENLPIGTAANLSGHSVETVVSLEDILYHLYVVQAIERGLADAEAGQTISHEDVRERLHRKWVLGTAG